MRLTELDGLRVSVLGYGREGRAAERLLTERGLPPAAVFTGDVPCPRNPKGNYRAGLPDAADLAQFDVVIRSPGISPYREPLASLPADGPRVVTGADIWFSEHPDACSVVVTGTKGKSTTASLLAHLARSVGRRVALGGNIGVPLLELVDTSPEPDLWVIELSSFQIHGLTGRPSMAVFLNLYPEHLDWHGSEERYFADKLSLLSGMTSGVVIVNGDDPRLRQSVPPDTECRFFNDETAIHVRGNRVYDRDRSLFGLEAFPLAGAHNRSNLCAALTVLKELGLDPADLEPHIRSFQPLPHRLQPIGSVDGVAYIDDSISTTPQSTIAALESFPGHCITVLVGGHDRGLDWSGFANYLACNEYVRVVTFGDAGPRIAAALDGAVQAGSLADAVGKARELAERGGVVLLSPGCPSFDEFTDYADRGEHFRELVSSR